MRIFLNAVIILALLSGCSHITTRSSHDVPDCPEIQSYSVPPSVQAPLDFMKTIARLEKKAVRTGEEAARANLELSLLYIHHKNPSPQYGKALESLEQYIQLSGTQKQPDYIYDRLAILRQVTDRNVSLKTKDTLLDEKESLIELMREDNRTLMMENQKIIDEKKAVEEENFVMKQMLERLNQIDMQHEKKRKQIK